MMQPFVQPVELFARSIGKRLINFLIHVGRVAMLVGRMVRTAPQIFSNPRLTLDQMVVVGIQSIPLVFVVSIFAGATTAWQAKYQLEGLVASEMIGTAVIKSLLLELGPVLTALVVAGRYGSSISAELATMRVTEQIDALITMSIDPVRYLILPRVTAGIVMVPILVALSIMFGLVGGYFTAVTVGGISGAKFLQGVQLFFYVRDVAVGLFKAYVFGAVITLMGCYFGNIAKGGASGVGEAAIKSFVSSAVMILVADFLVAFVAFTT
jgi:phospholipid/cholesterol/gamma-HCH transport system permease protein